MKTQIVPSLGALLLLIAGGRFGLALLPADIPSSVPVAGAAEAGPDDALQRLEQERRLLEQERSAMQIEAAPTGGVEVRRLAGIYGAMPPAQSAAILAALPPQQAASVLAALPERQAGSILAGMETAQAVAILKTVGSGSD